MNAGWPGRTFGRSHGRSGYENERRNRDHRQLARKTGQSLSLVEREGGREGGSRETKSASPRSVTVLSGPVEGLRHLEHGERERPRD